MMIEPQRLLSRMNPVAVDWQNSIRVTGDVLRAEHVAACLAGLERGPYLLLRHLWCQDESNQRELYGILLVEIIHIADKHHWTCRNDFRQLARLIKMALSELKNAHICKPCQGTGVKANEKCLRCHGHGKKRLSQAECARVCGVKPANWKRSWAHKYQEVYLWISDWNERGINHLLSRL